MSTLHLPAGTRLTITTDAVSSGTIAKINLGSNNDSPSVIAVSTTTLIGPFNAPRDYIVSTDKGTLVQSKSSESIVEGLTSSVAELNIMDGVTATSTELNLIDGYTGTTAELNLNDSQTATAEEVNNAADVSTRVQALTATGNVNTGVQSVELDHPSVAITATINNSNSHAGLLIVKNTSASGTESHVLTLTTGTFDGTNDTATLNAPNEALIVYIDSAGDGTIIENVGSVVLS